jgi:glycosyltransferase involved in cell wall biosynthesis
MTKGVKMMKVALIDNMNNMFFSFCRYLRDRGINAHLFVIPGMPEHFTPENDTFENVSELDYIHEFPIRTTSRTWLLSLGGTFINLDCIKSYDVIIACGGSLAFLNRKGINVDIFIPYGFDLKLPFLVDLKHRPVSFAHYWFSVYQRKGIFSSRYVIGLKKHAFFNSALNKLDMDYLEMGIPMVYNKKRFEKYGDHWNFFKNHDFIVFSQARQLWYTNAYNMNDFDVHGGVKRNDKLIKAFARFIEQSSFKSPILVLFEYGTDVQASKALIDEIGITNYVRWMHQMPRKYIVQGLRLASLACDSFRYGLVNINGTSAESMSEGVPLIRYMGDTLQDKNSKFYKAPIINALEEDEIFNVFVDYEKNQDKYKAIGKAGLKWFNEQLGEGLVDEYIKLIEQIYHQKRQEANN